MTFMMVGRWVYILAEPLVPEHSLVDVEITIGQLRGYKSLHTDQIPAEMIKVGSEILRSELHRLIRYIWNK
jgi:hypothetical protein